MSKWTHAICIRCWNEQHPHEKTLGWAETGPLETCCFCSLPTHSGIYVRENPEKLNCRGMHAHYPNGKEE